MNTTFKNPYFSQVSFLLEKIENTQTAVMEKAAQAVADTLLNDGVIHTFGCGHSASVAVDAFHRSGCFAAVDAILDSGLMFQSGAHAGTAFERLEGYAQAVLARHQFRRQDILVLMCEKRTARYISPDKQNNPLPGIIFRSGEEQDSYYRTFLCR